MAQATTPIGGTTDTNDATDASHEVSGPDHTSPARLALADSLRRLGNGLVAHQPDDDLLARIAAQVDGFLPDVLAAPERPHAFHVSDGGVFSEARPDGPDAAVKNAFPDCVVSGRANPMGIAARLWRDGDDAVCQVTLGEAFEGAPGRAHGGIVASLIDETMGLAISMARTPAYTGRLTVTYRAPTPVGQLLEVRARLHERSGRKLTIHAELRAGEMLLAQGEGLFIAVDPDAFFTPSA
jgi:acyl-coenzyme A thioesterase PaaI-like protein